MSIESVSTPTRSRPRLHTGLRLQIVLALAGLMALAFGPLFFAVASLTQATVVELQEQTARLLAHSIAIRAGESWALDGLEALRSTLKSFEQLPEAQSICAVARNGSRVTCVGAPPEDESSEWRAGVLAETVRSLRGRTGLIFEVASPVPEGAIVMRLRLNAVAARAPPLMRLVALYMLVFAIALLMFAYFALTRLIVRPIEELARAADRVAGGARALNVPRAGARELVHLGASVQAMAQSLLANESALLAKVQELTATTAQLTSTQAQLVRSERLASVGRLAAGVAHEIGNPIAALMGLEDLLLEPGLPEDARRDFLRRMRNETDRIHSVVRDLLDFARPEQPVRTDSSAPPADVRSVVEDVVALVRPQRLFRDVEIKTEIEGTPHVLLAAPRLTQVLLNIVLNAGAAVASNGRTGGRVTLRVRASSPRAARIEIEDDGPGIAPEMKDRLFEPFTTNKGIGQGTGLGLAVCRGLVESASGQIGVDANYEHGARFFVELPSVDMPNG